MGLARRLQDVKDVKREARPGAIARRILTRMKAVKWKLWRRKGPYIWRMDDTWRLISGTSTIVLEKLQRWCLRSSIIVIEARTRITMRRRWWKVEDKRRDIFRRRRCFPLLSKHDWYPNQEVHAVLGVPASPGPLLLDRDSELFSSTARSTVNDHQNTPARRAATHNSFSPKSQGVRCTDAHTIRIGPYCILPFINMGLKYAQSFDWRPTPWLVVRSYIIVCQSSNQMEAGRSSPRRRIFYILDFNENGECRCSCKAIQTLILIHLTLREL